MKLKSKLSLGLAGIALASGLAGCVAKNPNFFEYKGNYEGYPSKIGVTNELRYILIGVNDTFYDNIQSDGVVVAHDFQNDGRFDEIRRNNLSKGHPLEDLTNSFEDMEEIYTTLKAEYDKNIAGAIKK
ncbi:MAG TPA: hypothetical protein VI815_03330 [Candidatus Nanoarchaeia archaeon]|nr:hypothetical protein [Candidatus Nanoarchaeia archaeon]